MSRNLVVCFDGTNNQFGRENTSVVRLVQVLAHDPRLQLRHYDPGVGTLPEPGFVTRWGKRFSEALGLAFGAGLARNVEEAYGYLMDQWQPEDRVFLFGFSRGAYTARVLAGLLHSLGLLPSGAENLLPYAMRLYGALRGTRPGQRGAHFDLCDQFRSTFARPVPGGDAERRLRVQFLGLWDTVSSVGWVWDPVTYPFTTHNPSVDVIRHAIAIDERRCFFRQNRMQPEGAQDLVEHWFPGVHSDVGGGYPEAEGGLWRRPFAWLLDAARAAGLLVDEARLKQVLDRSAASPQPWLDRQHESLTAAWWPAEFFPKLVFRPGLGRRVPELGLGRRRHVPSGALIDNSALLRLRQTSYAPPNLSAAFVARVKALLIVPEALPYEP